MSQDISTEDDFIILTEPIKAIQQQVQQVPEIGDSFAYSTTFATYKISNTTNAGRDICKDFNNNDTSAIYDSNTLIIDKQSIFHTFRRCSDSGILWMLTKSTIDMIRPGQVLTSIEIVVNFDINDESGAWYVVNFYYDLISIDEKLKASHLAKAKL